MSEEPPFPTGCPCGKHFDSAAHIETGAENVVDRVLWPCGSIQNELRQRRKAPSETLVESLMNFLRGMSYDVVFDSLSPLVAFFL